MKFQNPSMQGSEVMLCIKKGVTHGHTGAWTNEPEAICPSTFLEVRGIMSTHNVCSYRENHKKKKHNNIT